MQTSYVYFPAKEQAAFSVRELDEHLSGDEVLVKTDYDVISAGTELANYHDLPNLAGIHETPPYPRYPGYSLSGHVTAVGPEAKQLQVGDRVVIPWGGRASWVKRSETKLFKVSAGVDQQSAALAHICSFPLLGVRRLELQLGEGVVVAGLGILGLFAVQLARLAGACPVIAADFTEERRKLALSLGADYALDPRDKDFVQQVRDLTDGKGPAATVEVTGHLSGLLQALDYTAMLGRISVLGCTRISDQPINVYRYIHAKGISVIGAHTMVRPKNDSRPGAWTEHDDYATFMKLVEGGRLQTKPLISRIVSPRDCDQVYRTLGFEKLPPLGVLFDWRDIDA